jgi:hypothetical protein
MLLTHVLYMLQSNLAFFFASSHIGVQLDDYFHRTVNHSWLSFSKHIYAMKTINLRFFLKVSRISLDRFRVFKIYTKIT